MSAPVRKPRRLWLRWLPGLVVVGLLVGFFALTAPERAVGDRRPVIVFSAASLTDVVTELAAEFEGSHPEFEVVTVFASSSTLARQIAQGASADLYLSANIDWMDRLASEDLIVEDSRREFLGNELVVIGPADRQTGPSSVFELVAPDVDRIAVAEPTSVPAGIYAREALESLGLWSAIESKIVSASDVRVAVAYVEREEVDAALVYRTDARVSPLVRELFALPEQNQPDIRYSFAIVSGSPEPGEAQRLLDFIEGRRGWEVFERFGFSWRGAGPAPIASTGPSVSTGHTSVSNSSVSDVSAADDWGIVRLSLFVAALAVLLILPPGILVGWLLARRQFLGKSVVENVANLPLVLPPAVTGFILLVVLGRKGLVGGPIYELFGVQIAFTWLAAALAAASVSFPLLVQSVRVATEAIDPGLEAAARTLGAGPLRVAWTVTLPLATPGIVAGVVIAFARALGELGATLVFAGNTPGQTQTIPLAVWSRVSQVGGEASAVRLVVLSVIVSYLSLFAASRLRSRSVARSRGLK